MISRPDNIYIMSGFVHKEKTTKGLYVCQDVRSKTPYVYLRTYLFFYLFSHIVMFVHTYIYRIWL